MPNQAVSLEANNKFPIKKISREAGENKRHPTENGDSAPDALYTTYEVEVIVKITERCNINCTYCYFFNKEDKGFERHPKYISLEKAREMAKFIRDGASELSASGVLICLHGGEPLLWLSLVQYG